MGRAQKSASGRGRLAIVGLLALGVLALGAAAFALISSLGDGPKKQRPRPVVSAPSEPDVLPTPTPVAGGSAATEAATVPPKPHDPGVFDPNGDYRTIHAETPKPVASGTWAEFERIMRRKFQGNEQQRVEKLMNGWHEDRGTYQRALDEGRWSQADYARRNQQLFDGMKKRMSEMLQVEPGDTERLLLLFE